MASKKKSAPKPNTVITLTLPSEGGIQRIGTMLIQRGDLAVMSQFTYTNLGDIAHAIGEATNGLIEVEAAPPPTSFKDAKWETYKPDVEAKLKLLVDGTPVQAKDGNTGVIVGPEYGGDRDAIPVNVDRYWVGYYPPGDLTIVQPVTEQAAVDPLTVKPEKLPDTRPATDIPQSGQIALF